MSSCFQSITDQLGRRVDLAQRPQRIVSLCPSETETLASMVAADRIVGCTNYCKYPADVVSRLTKVGGTKRLDLDGILSLSPDLVFAVKEENDRDQIEALGQTVPVVVLDPIDHLTTFDSLRIMGRAVGEEEQANTIVTSLKEALHSLSQAHGQRACYLIWRKPYMTVGSGTFIHAMMESIGLVNAAQDLAGRYPELDSATIKTAKPDIILASSEPFPFEEQHREELENQFPGCRVYFIDGEAFGWHGVRTMHVVKTLDQLVQNILA